jgi:hypothetical protein
MMERSAQFKRMLLGLPHSATDYATVAFTGELAEMLGLDLVALFIEDENLRGLAGLPFARELRSRGEWQPIDAALLARSADQSVAEARRLFQEAAKSLRVGTSFNLAKGPIAEAIGSQSSADDIIAVIEPRNPAERVTHQFRQLMDVALNAPSPVLLVPSRIVRRRGPIVALASTAHDPSIHAALRIASSVRERLIVLAPPEVDEATIAGLARTSNVSVIRRPMMDRWPGPAELAAQLSCTSERFLVLSRTANHRLPPLLASERGVPVLVTETAKPEAG